MKFMYDNFPDKEDAAGIKPMFWQFQQEYYRNLRISGHFTTGAGSTDLAIFVLSI